MIHKTTETEKHRIECVEESSTQESTSEEKVTENESLKEKHMDAEKLEQVHKAILNNKTDELKNLVDEICSDMSSGNRKEVVQDLFLFAAKNRAYDIMKWMSKDSGWDIDVNYKDSHGRTALHYLAMDMIDSREMESMEETGILREKVLETAGMLVDKGVDVNAFDDTGFTALHHAAKTGFLKLVKFFLQDCQMDQAVRDPRKDDAKTPLELVPEGYKRIAKLFQSNEKENEYFEWVWKYFEDNKTDIDSLFCSCCRDYDSIRFKIPYHDRSLRDRCSGLLFLKRMHSKYDIDFSYKDEHGHSAFSNAAIGGNLDIVRWLVEKCGVNPKKHSRGRDNALVLAADSGKLDVIRCLIEEYGLDVNSKATKGNTPLLSVSDYTKIELIQYLVEHGADVNAKNSEGDTPLLIAISNGNGISFKSVQYLIMHGADVNAKNIFGNTPLLEASKRAWEFETVLYLIEHGADVNAKNNDEDTPLLNAIRCETSEFKTVQCLVEHGADVNAKNNEGYSVLYLVTWSDIYNEESLEWLINAGADCLGLGGQPEQILLKAAFFGKLSIIKSLVRDYGIDPNYHEEGGDYAIHVAASEINSRVVKWFVEEAGVDINAKGKMGITPLNRAIMDIYFGSERSIYDPDNLLFYEVDDYGEWLKEDEEKAEERQELIQWLVDHGADINMPDKHGNTPLHSAVSKYCDIGGEYFFSLVRWLVDHGADINMPGEYGRTPLRDLFQGILEEYEEYKYVAGRSFSLVEWLIDRGANINEVDEDGESALSSAAIYGFENGVKFLINHGADFKTFNKNGYNLMHHAANGGNLSLVKSLVKDYGMDPNCHKENGNWPIHVAASSNSLEVVKWFVEEVGTDINAKGKDGRTPLHSATDGWKVEMLKWLVSHGADVNATDNRGDTPLHLAVTKRNFKSFVAYLVEETDADINATNNEGKTPLVAAVEWVYEYAMFVREEDLDSGEAFDPEEPFYVEMEKYLVEHGANLDANTINHLRKTLFAYADAGMEGGVSFLVNLGVDYKTLDEDGHNLLHHAANGGNLSLVKSLVKEQGMDPNCHKENGDWPIHAAAEENQLEVVKWFVEDAGTDINAKGEGGKTPLHSAIYGYNEYDSWETEDDVELLRWLVSHGSDLNAVNDDNETALHMAAGFGDDESVKFFIEECHMDPTLDCGAGTPAEIAEENDNIDTVTYLHKKEKEYSAKGNK